MASDQQVALARAHRGSTSNLTKSARQVVPAFLQKLYEMVNDSSNNDLIRWADTGDSFFVLDHERFAREVLGRWFKHQNFSSFVRQLNMYGFHKIPHLQQGVLKSEAETEFWNFEHPNFRSGQPDLLCLIQRKKQTAQSTGNDDHLLEGAKDPSNPMATNGLTTGQLLDINAIASGIAVIKRHQTAISADLNDLKTSNQQLWQEALAARERHTKQQDTINRILKFLAGVFGQGGTPKHDGSHSPPAMMPRKRQRLMIGDADRNEGKARAVEIADVDDDEDEAMPLQSPTPTTVRGRSPFPGVQIASIDTPMSTLPTESPFSTPIAGSPLTSYLNVNSRPPSVTPTVMTPVNERPRGTPTLESPHHHPDKQPNMNSQTAPQSNGTIPSASASLPDQSPHTLPPTLDAYPALHQPQGVNASPYNPSAITSLTTTNNLPSDSASLQAAFQQMLNSPAQMQRFFQVLAGGSSLPGYPMPMDSGHQQTYGQSNYLSSLDPHTQAAQTQLQQYRVPSPGLYPPPPAPPQSQESQQLQRMDTTGIVEPLLQDAERLAKTYKDASEIDADVDALQTNIYSLIETLGLDPSLLNSVGLNGVNSMNGMNSVPPAGVHGDGGDGAMPAPGINHLEPTSSSSSNANQDFDFDAFLTEFSRDGGDVNGDYDFAEKLVSQTPGMNGNPAVQDASTEQLTAFLDEVASNTSDAAPSPVNSVLPSPQLVPQRPKAGVKRKSDTASLQFPDTIPPVKSVAPVNGDVSTAAGAGGGTKMKRKK